MINCEDCVRVLTIEYFCFMIKLIEKGLIMKSEAKWDIVKDSIIARLGGSPSCRLARQLTGYRALFYVLPLNNYIITLTAHMSIGF